MIQYFVESFIYSWEFPGGSFPQNAIECKKKKKRPETVYGVAFAARRRVGCDRFEILCQNFLGKFSRVP